MELNQEQRRVVQMGIDGAAKVVAGAGTGKTHVIVQRYLKFLLADRISPDRLLALTFTNKAAAEMKRRIFEAIRNEGDPYLQRKIYGAWIMNFHSFGRRILVENASLFGIDPGVDVACPADVSRIRRRLRREFEAGRLPGLAADFGTDVPPAKLARHFDTCMKIIHKCRTLRLSREELRSKVTDGDARGYRDTIESVVAIWDAYERALRERNLVDFDDLIEIVVVGLQSESVLREKYASRFDHILVDEFQDTSEAQNELLRILCGGDFGKVTVVGDEKQSIYRWRDARVENIRDFPSKSEHLKINYRSSQEILDVAHSFICKDAYFAEMRDEIRLDADRGSRGVPVVVFHPEESSGKAFEEEAKALAGWIRHLTEGIPIDEMGPLVGPETGRSMLRYDDIAILLRSLKGPRLRAYEAVLGAQNIPYAIVGGANAIENNALRVFQSLLRLLAAPDDLPSLLTVLEARPFSLTDAILKELFRAAEVEVEAASSGEEPQSVAPGGAKLDVHTLLSRRVVCALSDGEARRRCEDLRELLEALGRKRAMYDFRSFMVGVLEESPFFYHLFDEGATERLVMSLAKEIIAMLDALSKRNEASLSAFLEHLERAVDERAFEDPPEAVFPPGRLPIMTIHQAKGLEFPAVAVCGITKPTQGGEGFFLSRGTGLYLGGMDEWNRGYRELEERTAERKAMDQEERCLLYVAMTRAKDFLFISSPYPGGIVPGSREEHLLFPDIIESLDESRVARCELRRAPALPEVSAAHRRFGTVSTLSEVREALERWRSARDVLERTRDDFPGERVPVRFVNWRSLKFFEECPLKYYYRVIAGLAADLDIPGTGFVPDDVLDEKGETIGGEVLPGRVEPAIFGRFVHAVLEEMMRRPAGRRNESVRILESAADRSGLSGRMREQAVAGSQTRIDAFCSSPLARGRRIVCLEEPFQVVRRLLAFTGVFDRVDRTDEGYRVLDYKVGIEHEDYGFQIRFYAWALNEILDGKPVEGILVFLRDEAPKIREIDTGSGSIREIATLVKRLETATALNQYGSTPGEVCVTCPYRDVCLDAAT